MSMHVQGKGVSFTVEFLGNTSILRGELWT